MSLAGGPGGATGVLERPRERRERSTGLPPARPPDEGEGGGRGRGGDGGGFERLGPGPFGLALALLGITTLFLVLITVWLFLRRPAPDWLPGPAAAVRALWVSTGLLLASSATVEVAARRGRQAWLLASMLLGGAFLAAQAFLWWTLWRAGLVPESSGYAAVFFALTGLHALHVLGGLVFFGGLALELARARAHDRPGPSLRLGALYWHFMGAIWLVLFTLLYFVR